MCYCQHIYVLKCYNLHNAQYGERNFMKNNKVNTLYQRIRDLREDKDMTQKEVAQHINLLLTQYRRYEKAETPVTADFIKNISKLYNVSADYVLGLTNNKQKFW